MRNFFIIRGNEKRNMFDRVPHNVIYRDDIVYGAKKLITFHKFMTLTKKKIFFVPLVFSHRTQKMYYIRFCVSYFHLTHTYMIFILAFFWSDLTMKMKIVLCTRKKIFSFFSHSRDFFLFPLLLIVSYAIL